jgi:hypothetical protein
MKKPFILLGLALMLCGTLSAQDITQNVLRCRGDRVKNLANGDDINFDVDVRITQQQKIEWIQKGGQLIHTYSIVAVNGSWTDVSQPGSITYTVTCQDKRGEVRVERDATGLSITCNTRNGTEGSYYKLIIESVSLE